MSPPINPVRFNKLTVFRDRGLPADTSIFIDLGIERARRLHRVTYMSLPGIGDTGDRIIWHQKQ